MKRAARKRTRGLVDAVDQPFTVGYSVSPDVYLSATWNPRLFAGEDEEKPVEYHPKRARTRWEE